MRARLHQPRLHLSRLHLTHAASNILPTLAVSIVCARAFVYLVTLETHAGNAC